MSSDVTLPNRANCILRQHRAAAKQLPEPGDTWLAREVPAELKSALRQFATSTIVDVVDRTDACPGGDSRRVYETRPAAYRAAQALERRGVLPCGHSGFRNIDGELFACSSDDCDATHDRATIAEVFG
jgi:hypothetical protein